MIPLSSFEETTQPSTLIRPKSAILRGIAAFISYVFHPIFIPAYVVAFLLYVHPSLFSGFSALQKGRTMIISIINMVAFPLISVLLLKGLGFIDSIFLRTRKDRIIPYIASGIFFFWAYTVFHQQENYPPLLSAFIFGVFLASSVALIANIYFKVSMHAIGVGGLTGVFIVMANNYSILMAWPLCVAVFITGLVCTARLIVSDHNQKDIYGGLFIGLVTQLVAAYIML
jgi:hypothetical protein